MQLTGQASVVDNADLMDTILKKITQVHARLGEYKGLGIGSREIFTEI